MKSVLKTYGNDVKEIHIDRLDFYVLPRGSGTVQHSNILQLRHEHNILPHEY